MGATAQGLLSGVSLGLAGATGALVGGVLYEWSGPALMFAWSGVVVLVGLLFFALAGRQEQALQQATETVQPLPAPTSPPDH